MGPVLVLANGGADGEVDRATRASLTLARRLGTPAAVLCGPADPASVATLGRFGAADVYHVRGPGLEDHPVALRVQALAELARDLSPVAVVIAADLYGKEVAARLAVRLDSGLVADAVELRAGPAGPVGVRSVLSHGYLVESMVARGVPVFTVRTEAVAPDPAPTTPTVHSVRLVPPRPLRAARLASRVPHARGRRPELCTAAVVVAGGRGLGSRRGFALVDRLADALGGAVGGSYTATELGWCPREARVDQVGTVVHPQLYLALGISGSVRHRAGMRRAATVVAIDRDPAAPLLRVADLAVVGDVHEVVPELLAEVERRRARLVRQ